MSADSPTRGASTGTDAVTVVVAEPNELMSTVMLTALADERFAVGTYAGAIPGLAVATRHAQVLVVGPSMPRIGLPAMIPRLIGAGTRLLVVSDAGFDEEASMLLLAGATGFLSLADAGLQDVADAVLAISRGSTAVNPEVVHTVLQHWRDQRAAPRSGGDDPPVPELTTRELEVLLALSDGLTNRLIARRLGVAEKTIETHKSKLFAKLGARNQAQAVQLAASRGLV